MHNDTQDFKSVITQQKTYFQTGSTLSFKTRIEALGKIENLIRRNQDAICEALYADLKKPKQESLIAEIAVVLDEIVIAKKNLHRWMKPQRVTSSLALLPSKSRILFEPLGVVLIISPWNYPFQLAMSPLIGAVAAGNCAVVKPSEHSEHTSQLIAELLSKEFSPDFINVILGGVAETTGLLEQEFDHIFFTGSTEVGKVIMAAAAKNLTPVTLELGGKSPVVVSKKSDLDLAARRITWGKFYNAGQTCVAPDYVYVQSSIASDFLEKVKTNIRLQFDEDTKSSPSYGRIISKRHCERLIKLIDQDKLAFGGATSPDQRFIEPTLLKEVQWSDQVMQEEIFGPILPILTFNELEDAFSAINNQPKPLAAYFFSDSKAEQNAFAQRVSFGGGCINDVLVHVSNPYLPFGGVGHSGMGSYHGKTSFQTFSHAKSIMYRYKYFDLSARYAPYTDKKLNLLRKLFHI